MTVAEMIAQRTAKLTAIKDRSNAAVTAKGGTAADDLSGLPAAIESITSGGGALPVLTNPAEVGHVIAGKEYIDGSGNKQTGTLVVCDSIEEIESIGEAGVGLIVDIESPADGSAGALTIPEQHLLPENIKNGVSIFGIAGSAKTLRVETGTITPAEDITAIDIACTAGYRLFVLKLASGVVSGKARWKEIYCTPGIAPAPNGTRNANARYLDANGNIQYTIEGNTSATSGVVSNGGCVAEKSYPLDYARIAGYGRPKYELAEKGEKTMLFGVDLSEFQAGIDFSKLKAEGVEFVILRGGDGDYQDKAFDALYEAAGKQNMPVGAYWFSRATTVQRAKQEAETMCRRLKGKRITLPVYIDCEANALRAIGKRALTDVVLAWADVIRAAGYIPGVYTTEEWLNNYMILPELSGVEKWIAKWSANKPKLDCGMWQFGGETNYLRSPKIAGMTVDQNYLFKDYMEGNMKRFYKIADLKADENAKKYYLPTVEKLIAMGVGYKGGTGDDTIIDLGEDTVRMLVILDKLGKFDEVISENGADAKQVIREIADILVKSAE